MQTLLAISILSFLGVVWVAIAFAKHIKRGPRPKLSIVPATRSTLPRPDFKQHLFAAPEIAALSPAAPRIALTPEAPVQRTRIAELNQSVRDIAANKQWSMPPQPTRAQRTIVHRVEPPKSMLVPNTDLRKPPQPTRHGNMELLDPTYFNKDMGDLTDPYQPPRLHANGRMKASSNY
ncbi:hypothetical protein [Granulicella sp. dw_53]|uniref:hypothetical protein n=1 Tax=Granulicella sp. dw_53 TaxID=2719792 RepID=UPI001BD489E6|nr:hypothetical protein [Granulicella sp. dw_53]